MKLSEFPAEAVGTGDVKLSDSYAEVAEMSEYDWEEAWNIATDRNKGAFGANDVAEVLHFYGYSPEGYGSVDMEAVFRLKDGRFGTLCAWADTTGWGCQDDSEVKVFATYEEAMKLGIDEQYRDWFAAPTETKGEA